MDPLATSLIVFGVDPLHHDDGRRHLEHVDATPLDGRLRPAFTAYLDRVALHLSVGTVALERDEPATPPKQGSAPRPQSSKRSDRSRDDYIGTRELLLDGWFFRAAPNHSCGQRKSIDDFGQPRHPPSHWLQKGEIEVRSEDTEWDTG